MNYIVAKDNLNRDYHNDRLVTMQKMGQSLQDLIDKCDTINANHGSLFYTVTNDLSTMYLMSMYDCNGETPAFDIFCNYTGLGILPHEQALAMYNQHFNIQG